MVLSKRSEKLITLAIVVMLAIALAQAGWMIYTFFVAPRIEIGQLQANMLDLRGQSIPDLSSLLPIGEASVENELNAPMTVIAFLLTTCPACNAARPTLEALRQENPAKIGFIGIFAELLEIVRDYSATYPKFLDPNREIFDIFGANSVPKLVIVREGRVIEQFVGWSPVIGRNLSSLVKDRG